MLSLLAYLSFWQITDVDFSFFFKRIILLCYRKDNDVFVGTFFSNFFLVIKGRIEELFGGVSTRFNQLFFSNFSVVGNLDVLFQIISTCFRKNRSCLNFLCTWKLFEKVVSLGPSAVDLTSQWSCRDCQFWTFGKILQPLFELCKFFLPAVR